MTYFHPLEESTIREITKLRKRSYRSQKKRVIVEGYSEFRQAVQAGVPVESLYISPPVIDKDPKEFEKYHPIFISEEDFAKIAFGSRLKGILAICEPRTMHLSDMRFKHPDPLVVILENVEKPGNLGTVIRSCDGAGCDAVIVCDGKTDIYNQHVVRSSIGTVFSIPVVSTNSEGTYRFLKHKNFDIIGATAQATKQYWKADLTRATALIFGNEHSGLSDFWREQADELVKIPMEGSGRCLNIAMSASVLVYEANRQREQSVKGEHTWQKQAHGTFLSKQRMNATN